MKKQMLTAMLIASLLISGCGQTGEASSSSELPEASRSSVVDNVPEVPTEKELTELFINAMHEINELATEDPSMVIKGIFDDIEIDYDDRVTIDCFSYVKTSKKYNDLVDYYGTVFIDEALEWILSTKFADIDGTLYFWTGGGATGISTELISIEKLQNANYRADYLIYYGFSDPEETSTIFEIKKNDAGYRISSIDYHPDLLDLDLLKKRMGLE
ncbi:MAG: hypothetical protein KH009_08830 [Clostridiales bacterium]|nr:hypothetical protein [Clostridiales bacterium]